MFCDLTLGLLFRWCLVLGLLRRLKVGGVACECFLSFVFLGEVGVTGCKVQLVLGLNVPGKHRAGTGHVPLPGGTAHSLSPPRTSWMIPSRPQVEVADGSPR